MFKYSGIKSSKNQRYLLSVLIPVYNVQKWLDDCIQSLSSQTLKNVEYIFIDDGSTDKSGELLDSFALKDPRVKVIHLLNNEGLLKARRHAIDVARGKYAFILDSDDYLPTNTTLEDLLAFSQANDVDILQFSIACIGGYPLGGGTPLELKKVLITQESIYLRIDHLFLRTYFRKISMVHLLCGISFIELTF